MLRLNLKDPPESVRKYLKISSYKFVVVLLFRDVYISKKKRKDKHFNHVLRYLVSSFILLFSKGLYFSFIPLPIPTSLLSIKISSLVIRNDSRFSVNDSHDKRFPKFLCRGGLYGIMVENSTL